jgi:hypothetical protein
LIASTSSIGPSPSERSVARLSGRSAACGVDGAGPGLHERPAGVRARSTINRGDSGGPLLVPGPCEVGVRQVGVTSLGADSTTELDPGFQSLPVAAAWIEGAIDSLPG